MSTSIMKFPFPHLLLDRTFLQFMNSMGNSSSIFMYPQLIQLSSSHCVDCDQWPLKQKLQNLADLLFWLGFLRLFNWWMFWVRICFQFRQQNQSRFLSFDVSSILTILCCWKYILVSIRIRSISNTISIWCSYSYPYFSKFLRGVKLIVDNVSYDF